MKNPDSEEIFELIHLLESRQRRRVTATFIGLLLAAVIAGVIARLSYFEAQQPFIGVGGLREAREDGQEELERVRAEMLQMKAETDRLQKELKHVREERLPTNAEAERVKRGGAHAKLASQSGSKELVEMRNRVNRLERELATTREQLKLEKQKVADTQRLDTRKRVNRLERELAATREQLQQERQNVAVLSEKADTYRKDALELQRLLNERAHHNLLNQALAYTYRKAPGDEQRAEKAYRDAIQIAKTKDIRDPTIYNAYAIFLQDHGKFEDAEKFYNMALQVDPQYGKALNNLGTLYESTGDFKHALEKYKASGDAGEALGKENYLRLRSVITQ
jgi:Flp pilus assembly protein TadD